MELKYKGIFGIGRRLGRHCGQALIGSPLLQDIDVVVPIPLHRSRLVERGYNQAEEIAKGFCEVTGIRMDNKSISRFRRTHTQTKKGKADRWESMSTVFRINEPLNGGVLLLDDVMTTGSTLVGCASVLNRQVIRPACVKLFTVGMTRSFK